MDRAKILIVDDGFDLRRGPNLRLRANNYDVVYAADGLSAMAAAQKEHPDLIILDICMPAGDGFTVMERLQKTATLACIPVIILTARDPQYHKDRAFRAGATAFFRNRSTTRNCRVLSAAHCNRLWPRRPQRHRRALGRSHFCRTTGPEWGPLFRQDRQTGFPPHRRGSLP